MVDVYNINTNTWTVIYLSQPRGNLAVTSVGNFVIFAGGSDGQVRNYLYLFQRLNYFFKVVTATVDIYNINTDSFTSASLSIPRTYLVATYAGNLAIVAGGQNGVS